MMNKRILPDNNRLWNVYASKLHYTPYTGINSFSRPLTPETSYATEGVRERGRYLAEFAEKLYRGD